MKNSYIDHDKHQHILDDAQPAKNFLRNSGFQLLQRNNENPHALPAQLKFVKQRPNNSLLSAQPDETFDRLGPFLEKVSFVADEYLYQPGDLIDYLYFPETAVISDLRILEDGRTIETAMVGPEGVIGFASLLGPKRSSSWLQATVAGSALRINLNVFRKEFYSACALQNQLFNYISCYINQISLRTMCSNFHTVRQRFCNWLLMIGKRGHNAALDFTQEKIARNLGIHRPTLSYIAKSLQRDKIIDYRRGRLLILNLSELESYSCDCHRQIDSW